MRSAFFRATSRASNLLSSSAGATGALVKRTFASTTTGSAATTALKRVSRPLLFSAALAGTAITALAASPASGSSTASSGHGHALSPLDVPECQVSTAIRGMIGFPAVTEPAYPEVSHYEGPPKPPVRPRWSPTAEAFFADFSEQGYVQIPQTFSTHSFVAGGHGVERRVQFRFYVKRGDVLPNSDFSLAPATGGRTIDPKAKAALAEASPLQAGASVLHGTPHHTTNNISSKVIDKAASAPVAAAAVKSDAAAAAPVSKKVSATTVSDFDPQGNGLSLSGIIHFGPDAQGPKDCVHGGAIAALADSAMGQAVAAAGMSCVTANLSVNYRSLIRTSSFSRYFSKA